MSYIQYIAASWSLVWWVSSDGFYFLRRLCHAGFCTQGPVLWLWFNLRTKLMMWIPGRWSSDDGEWTEHRLQAWPSASHPRAAGSIATGRTACGSNKKYKYDYVVLQFVIQTLFLLPRQRNMQWNKALRVSWWSRLSPISNSSLPICRWDVETFSWPFELSLWCVMEFVTICLIDFHK